MTDKKATEAKKAATGAIVGDDLIPDARERPGTAELLARAADMLDQQQGPRANKFYRGLAVQVRRIAARLTAASDKTRG